MFAIIETGGKQVKVTEGQEIFVEKINAEVGSKVTFNKVLLASKGDKVLVGAPYAEVSVTAKVIKHGRGPKLVVFKYKDKNNDKVKKGHRQPYTKLVIEKINA